MDYMDIFDDAYFEALMKGEMMEMGDLSEPGEEEEINILESREDKKPKILVSVTKENAAEKFQAQKLEYELKNRGDKRNDLEYIVDDKNGIKRLTHNAFVFIARSPVGGYIHYDEFTHQVICSKDVDFYGYKIKRGTLPVEFDDIVKNVASGRLKIEFSKDSISSALWSYLYDNKVNTGKMMLEKAARKRKNKNVIEGFVRKYLGATGEFDDIMFKTFLVGAVGKIRNSGFKFDYTLDLVGGQGVGKTTFLAKIANGFYTDQVVDFDNKDDRSIMLKSLIVNDDEMEASRLLSFEALKRFVTYTTLTYRAPYARVAEEHDKNFVIARTTNKVEYLKDFTGSRRFLPIMCNKNKAQKFSFDINQQEIWDLWAEADELYKSGFDTWLGVEIEEKISESIHGDVSDIPEEVQLTEEFLREKMPVGISAWPLEKKATYFRAKYGLGDLVDDRFDDLEMEKITQFNPQSLRLYSEQFGIIWDRMPKAVSLWLKVKGWRSKTRDIGGKKVRVMENVDRVNEIRESSEGV